MSAAEVLLLVAWFILHTDPPPFPVILVQYYYWVNMIRQGSYEEIWILTDSKMKKKTVKIYEGTGSGFKNII